MTTPNTPGIKRPAHRPKGSKDKKPRFNASVTESFSVRIHKTVKRLFFKKTKPKERRAIVEGWIKANYEKPCDGMADPVAEVAALRECAEALRSAAEALRQCYDVKSYPATPDCYQAVALAEADAALAKLPKTTKGEKP